MAYSIDLSGIDADTTQEGDQAFNWDLAVGTAGAIDAVWDAAQGAWLVSWDVDGGGADTTMYLAVNSCGDIVV